MDKDTTKEMRTKGYDQVTAPRMALCVDRSQVHLPYGKWRTYLMDRDIVDDKQLVITKIQQILLYLSFTRTHEHRKQVLTYSRGGLGNEARLHGKLSIGYGGHTETDVPNLHMSGSFINRFFEETMAETAILYHLACNAVKEAVEELPGVFLASDGNLYRADEPEFEHLELSGMYPELFDAIIAGLRNRDFMQLDTPVESVHLGISVVIDFTGIPTTPDVEFQDEEGQVQKSHWAFVDELQSSGYFQRFEAWSKAVGYDALGITPEAADA